MDISSIEKFVGLQIWKQIEEVALLDTMFAPDPFTVTTPEISDLRSYRFGR